MWMSETYPLRQTPFTSPDTPSTANNLLGECGEESVFRHLNIISYTHTMHSDVGGWVCMLLVMEERQVKQLIFLSL